MPPVLEQILPVATNIDADFLSVDGMTLQALVLARECHGVAAKVALSAHAFDEMIEKLAACIHVGT